MKKVWYKLQTSIRGNIKRNTVFRGHIKNKHTKSTNITVL